MSQMPLDVVRRGVSVPHASDLRALRQRTDGRQRGGIAAVDEHQFRAEHLTTQLKRRYIIGRGASLVSLASPRQRERPRRNLLDARKPPLLVLRRRKPVREEPAQRLVTRP